MVEKFAMLKVEGVHCEGCASNIQQALKSMESVKEVRVDVKRGNVTVRFDDESANMGHFKDAIHKAGYKVA